MNLKGKVALITGGGTGIGAAVARRFVDEGAKVCITGRRSEMLEKMAKTLPKDTIITCTGDVANYEDVKRMVETAAKFGGKLDVLVNNAGITYMTNIVDFPLEEWNKVLSVNLTGPFLLMKEAIPHMLKAGGGSIVNVASLAGIRGLSASPAYSASKAGLIQLSKQVALDYGPQKIRCNVVIPGAVRTDMTEDGLGVLSKTLGKSIEETIALLTRFSPLRRAAAPEEISGACSFLASDDSSFMTGAELVLDGGVAIVDVNGVAISTVGKIA